MSVSVIIPTYNRFKYLLNAIESVRNQTYKAHQIIVVNDGSSEPEYYSHNFGDDVIIVHLSKNTFTFFGTKLPGCIRNIGSMLATGKYIAFLDDDDVWLPEKLELQISELEKTHCLMSCTEGLIGEGVYDKTKLYPKYHSEYHFSTLKNIFSMTNILVHGLPSIFNENMLKIHNCCIASSVIVDRELFIKAGMFKMLPPGQEDYDCWLRILKYTDCCHVSQPCVYYDQRHGDGRLYI